MTNNKLMLELTDVFQDLFDDPNLQITPETTATDIPDWDSVNHINLVIAVEMRFKVKFHAAEIEELKNVGDLLKLIERKQSAG